MDHLVSHHWFYGSYENNAISNTNYCWMHVFHSEWLVFQRNIARDINANRWWNGTRWSIPILFRNFNWPIIFLSQLYLSNPFFVAKWNDRNEQFSELDFRIPADSLCVLNLVVRIFLFMVQASFCYDSIVCWHICSNYDEYFNEDEAKCWHAVLLPDGIVTAKLTSNKTEESV